MREPQEGDRFVGDVVNYFNINNSSFFPFSNGEAWYVIRRMTRLDVEVIPSHTPSRWFYLRKSMLEWLEEHQIWVFKYPKGG